VRVCMYAKCENQLVLAYIAFFFYGKQLMLAYIAFFFFGKQLVLAYIAFIFSFSRNNWCSHTLHLIFLFRETIGARIHCIYSFFFEKQLVLAYIAFIFSLFCKTGLFCKRASRHRDTERHDTDTAIQQDTVPT